MTISPPDVSKKDLIQVGKFKPRMKPNISGKINYSRTILIGFAYFSAQIAWAYYNFSMPLILREYIIDMNITWIGIDTFVGGIMVLDNLVAIVLLPYFGVLSDHTRSRFGKRMPYILVGCVFGSITFSFIPYMEVFGGLMAIILLFNFSMAFYKSCAVSLMPDLTEPKVRSTANSVIGIMGAFALVMAYAGPVIMGFFFDTETLEGKSLARTWGFHYVSFFMIVAIIILFLTIKETPTGDKFLRFSNNSIHIDPMNYQYLGEDSSPRTIKQSKFEYLKTVFKEEDKSPIFLLLAIFATNFGFNAIETYYSSFATLYLGWTESKASMVLLLAPISLVVAAIPIGWFSDKIGRKKAMVIGFIGISIGVEVLHYLDKIITSSEQALYIGNIVVIIFTGIFYALVSVNSIVLVWALSPPEKIGAFTGTFYLFSQGAQILSPVVAGMEFDLYKSLNPQQMIKFGFGYQYRMLFVFVLVWQLIALLCISRVQVHKEKNFSKDEIQKIQLEHGNTLD
jgi:MFS family permease